MPKLFQQLWQIMAIWQVTAIWQVSAVSAVLTFQHFDSFGTNKPVSTFGTRPNEFRQATLIPVIQKSINKKIQTPLSIANLDIANNTI
jgi:hypothetical protein